MTLSIRSTLPEEMDDEDLDTASYERCLTELDFINRITFTHRPTLHWLARATRDLPVGVTFSVLDVGYGHGDLLRAIARWADKRGLNAHLSGIDLNPRSAAAARAATAPNVAIDYLTGDVFSYTPPTQVDFIVSSQFTHHLTDGQIVMFIRWMEARARRGWFIGDLHRHWLPYYGFGALAWLARWHHFVLSDGRISIARSFVPADWRRLVRAARLADDDDVAVSWHLPFRLCVARHCPTR